MKSPPYQSDQRPIAYELKTLGELIRNRRLLLGLSLVDASARAGISTSVLSRLECGKSIGTDSLFRVFYDFGLATWILPKDGDSVALAAAGQRVGWHEVTGGAAPATERPLPSRNEVRVFCLSQLQATPPRTPEDIRRLMAAGRFAEMTPGQAGDDDGEN